MALSTIGIRELVRQSARNAKDPSAYTNTRIDDAFKLAYDEFIRETKAQRQYDTITLTAGSYTLPTLPSGFLPEFLVRAFLTLDGQIIEPDIMLTDYETILRAQAEGWSALSQIYPNGPTDDVQPFFAAFTDTTAGVVFPTPDAAYTLNLQWSAQLPEWTSGGTGPTSFPLNDDALRVIAAKGTPWHLQGAEPVNATYAKALYGDFQRFMGQFAGRDVGGTAPQILIRRGPSWAAGGG